MAGPYTPWGFDLIIDKRYLIHSLPLRKLVNVLWRKTIRAERIGR